MKNALGSWTHPAQPAATKPKSKLTTTKGKSPVLVKPNISKKAPHPDEEIIFTPTVILTTGLLVSVAMAGAAHYAWDLRHLMSPEGTRYLYGVASVLAIGCSGVLALRFFGIALQQYREQAERSTKALERMNADELQNTHAKLIRQCIHAAKAARNSNDKAHKIMLGKRIRSYAHQIQFIERFLQKQFCIKIEIFNEQHQKTKAKTLKSTGEQAPLNAQNVESAVADSARRLMEEGWPLNPEDAQITKIHREIERTRASIVEAFIVFAGMEVWKLSEAQAKSMASAIALECMQMVNLEQSRPSIEESLQETLNTTPIAHVQKQRMALEVLSNTYRIYIRPSIEQQLREKTVIQDEQDPHKCRKPDTIARIEKALSSSREQLWRTLEADKYRSRTDLVQINNALQGLVQEIGGRGIHTPTEQLEQVQTRLKDIPAENDQSLMRIITAIKKELDDIQAELAKPILKQASGDVTGVTKEITRLKQILNNSSGTTAKIAQAIRALPEPQAPTAS